MAAIGTAAVSSFADYEQLVGGAQLMFGDAYDYIADKAKNAYSTVQMSQNDYLQQANGFATGLKTALNGDAQAAAELADKILTAEADIVAATGNSQEAVQNAFNGIMKSNFTMLDNLQIGITPTKEGFQEVIDKVNEWNAANGNATKYQISNLADCQSALIDYINMQGLSGYAQNEASKTIQGSLSMTKAAWTNLLTGIADDSADFDGLIDAFVESVSAVAENILPRIEVVFTGIGQLVEKLLPVIINRVPEILNNVLPKLITSGINMIQAIINGIQANFPVLMDSAVDIIMLLVDSFIGMLPQLLELGFQIIIEIALGIAEALPELVPTIIDVLLQIVDVLIANIDLLLDAALQLIMGLAEGLIASLPALIERLPEIVMTIVNVLIEYAPELLKAALMIITMLLEGLFQYLPQLLVMLPQLVARIVSTLSENAPKLIDSAIEFIGALVDGLWDNLSNLLNEIPEIVDDIVSAFTDTLENFVNFGAAIIDGIWSGISAGWEWLKSKVKEVAGSLFGAAKEELEINSPSRKFRWLAEMCCAGWDEGAEDLMSANSMTRNAKANLSTLQMNASGARVFGGTIAGWGGFQQIVNINQPVRTPDEMARTMRLESKYGLMRGDVVYG